MTFDAEKADAELKKYLSGLHPAQRQFFLRHAVYEQVIAAIPREDAILQGGAGVRYLVKHSAVAAHNLLKFTGIENKSFVVLSPEDLAAIKICIYLEDAGHPERFRPQDIAHCVAH